MWDSRRIMAEKRRIPIETVTVPLDRVDRAVIDEAAFGMLAVHLRRGTDRDPRCDTSGGARRRQ